MILSDWVGLAWIVGTIFVSFAAVGIGIICAEIFGREYAVLWIVAIQGAFQILIAFTSAQFVGLVLGGVTFITIAGSLIYPTLELGQNYLNEFYGLKISRTSVNANIAASAASPTVTATDSQPRCAVIDVAACGVGSPVCACRACTVTVAHALVTRLPTVNPAAARVSVRGTDRVQRQSRPRVRRDDRGAAESCDARPRR